MAAYPDWAVVNPYVQRHIKVKEEKQKEIIVQKQEAANDSNKDPNVFSPPPDNEVAGNPLKVTIPNLNGMQMAQNQPSTTLTPAGNAPFDFKPLPWAAPTAASASQDIDHAKMASDGPDTSPSAYQALPPMVKKQILHMASSQPGSATASVIPPLSSAQMAALAPAAGGDAPSTNAPMLQTPDQALPPLPPLSAQQFPPPNNPPPPVGANMPPPPLPINNPYPPAGANMPPSAPPSAINNPYPPSNANMPQLTMPSPPSGAGMPQPPVPLSDVKPLLPPSSLPPLPSMNSNAGAVPAGQMPPEMIPGASEPATSLSSESKNVLTKIPSNLGARSKASGPIAIDRAKQDDGLGAAEPSVKSVKHGGMDISIATKVPKPDAGFQLEEAYNAVNGGHTPEAIEIYKNVLNNDPNNIDALFGLATVYHRSGQIDTARALYARLLAIDPKNRDGLNNFLVLLADESPQDALTQLESLESRSPQFSPIPAQMAVIYQKMGDYDRACEKMYRAIDLSPENVTYRFNLAIMLDKQRKYEDAAKFYHEVVNAYERGEVIPGDIQKIQQRLTFISSNRP